MTTSRISSRRGYSLTELLVVIAIAAIIMSMSVGAFRTLSRKSELEANTQALRSLLRRARNAAREERFQATVSIDSVSGEVGAVTRQTLGLFRFEQSSGGGDLVAPTPSTDEAEDYTHRPLRGAFNIEADAVNTEAVVGRLGAALAFGAPRGGENDLMKLPPAWVQVEDRPSLNPVEGLALELWVYPGRLIDKLASGRSDGYDSKLPDEEDELFRETPPRTLPVRKDLPIFTMIRKGNAWSLSLNADHSVEIALRGPSPDGDEVVFIARSLPNLVPADRWSRVAMAFDGEFLRLQVNGIERQLNTLGNANVLPVRLAISKEALQFSDHNPRRTFYGVLDEVRIAGVIKATTLKIPRNILVLSKEPFVRFDARGSLDPLSHSESVTIEICDDPNIHEALVKDKEKRLSTTERGAKPAGPAAEREDFLKRWRKALRKVDPANRRTIVVDMHGFLK